MTATVTARRRGTRRYGPTLLVVVLVVVAGCSGLPGGSDDDQAGGVNATPPPDTGESPRGNATAGDGSAMSGDGSTTPTADAGGTGAPDTTAAGIGGTPTGPPATVAGEHPHLADGSLDVATLVGAHVDVLAGVDSVRLTNNGTARYVGNGSVAVRITSVREVDFADRRRWAVLRSVDGDGEVLSGTDRYENATTTCSRFDGTVECQSGGFDRHRALGQVVEITSLETVGGPDFVPNGTVERDGRELYRYTATSFRSSLSDRTRSELGPNATLRHASLLVAPNGRVVEYRIVYERDHGNARVVMDRTYLTTGVDATSLDRPSWVP